MKEMPPRPSRRLFLQTASLGLGSAVAGCLGLSSDEPEKPERSENAPPMKWIATVDRSPWHTPNMEDQTIYCGGTFYVSALDATDGSERWQYEIDTPNDVTCYAGQLGVADDTVYTVGCDRVHAINGDGEKQWAVDFNRNQHGSTVPAISETALFFGGDALVRRNRSTGNIDWQTDVQGSASAPTLGEQYVFIGTSTGGLQAVERTSGEVRFSVETEMNRASAPLLNEGTVLFGTVSSRDEGDLTGYLYAVDLNEESRLWRAETGPIYNTQPPAVHDDTVFVTNDTRTLYAVAATDGTVRWTFETAGDKPTAPRVGDDHVYVASEDRVHAVDMDTGNQSWHIKWNDTLIAGSDSTLLVTEDGLYTGTYDGFYAFDLS